MQTKQTNRMPSICKDILFLERLFFSALKITSTYHCKWLIINNICFILLFNNFDIVEVGILLSVLLASSFFAFLSSSFLVFLLLFPKHFFPGWSFPIGKVWLGKAINYFSSSYHSAFFSCFFLLSPFDFFSCFVWLSSCSSCFCVIRLSCSLCDWVCLFCARSFGLLLLHWSARPAPESSNFACSL